MRASGRDILGLLDVVAPGGGAGGGAAPAPSPVANTTGRGTSSVFYIYRYHTGIWTFFDCFGTGMVCVCGLRKWYDEILISVRSMESDFPIQLGHRRE